MEQALLSSTASRSWVKFMLVALLTLSNHLILCHPLLLLLSLPFHNIVQWLGIMALWIFSTSTVHCWQMLVLKGSTCCCHCQVWIKSLVKIRTAHCSATISGRSPMQIVISPLDGCVHQRKGSNSRDQNMASNPAAFWGHFLAWPDFLTSSAPPVVLSTVQEPSLHSFPGLAWVLGAVSGGGVPPSCFLWIKLFHRWNNLEFWLQEMPC